MKSLHVSDDILPIAEFKTHASQVVRRLHTDKRPIVITQNGKPAAVLLRPEEFDRLAWHARFTEAVEEGLRDSEAGRLVEDEDLDRDLDAAFGRNKKR